MPKHGELYEWDNDYLEIKDIAARIGCSYNTAVRFIQMNYTTTEQAKAIFQAGKGKREAKPIKAIKPIVAARIKPELKTSVNADYEVRPRIRHAKLHEMLCYLSRTTGASYQACFDEFINYIYEGRRWGAEWDTESYTALKERLMGHSNGHEIYEAEISDEKPHLRIAQLLEEYIVKLELENKGLKETIAKLKSFLGGLE